MDARRILLELFDAALRAADGHDAVARILRGFGPRPVALFAIGKAADSMARGAHAVLGSAIEEALIVTKDGHASPALARIPGVRILESAHPVPDERSLAAGAELERRVAHLRPGVHPVFLVSGGASSLVESLREGFTLADLRALNEHGLAAGWDIRALNAQRARVSRLKHGGVARLLCGRAAHALFISDVPGDDPGVIGSGLLGDADRDDCVLRIVVANIGAATHATCRHAAALGIVLERREQRFDGDAADVARDFVAALRATSADGVVWGGESTVKLPAHPGRGGRNTHLALAAARALRANEPLAILAAGTDGTDGPTGDAGAVVDAGTIERAGLGGCDVERAYAGFDSGTALEAAGDLVHTGPTGTNVGDILIGLKRPATQVRALRAERVL